jgi:hypothetical protein
VDVPQFIVAYRAPKQQYPMLLLATSLAFIAGLLSARVLPWPHPTKARALTRSPAFELPALPRVDERIATYWNTPPAEPAFFGAEDPSVPMNSPSWREQFHFSPGQSNVSRQLH